MSFISTAMLLGTAYPALTVGLSTATVAGSSTSSTVTSGSVTATKTGGSGQVVTAWGYVSGNASIVATSPNSAATSFQATGLGAGESRSAVWRATVRDAITGETLSTGNVTINLRRDYPSLSISGPGNVDGTQVSSSTVTVSGSTSVSASGGVPPYSYSWSYSGDFSMSGSGASRSFSRALAPQGGVLGSATVTVTDAIGQSESASCSVMLRNLGTAPSPLSAYASPASVSGYTLSNTCNTGSTSIIVSGGVGPYSYAWSRAGGVGSGGGGAGGSFSYSTAEDGDFYGTFQCLVTDSRGVQTACWVSASFSFGNLN
jgi:hypothetical protein